MTKLVTDQTYQSEVAQSTVPVLIDFYAPWCGPCKALSPTIDALADEKQSTLKVVKVDIDENPQIAAAFKIRSIPTLALVADNQIEDLRVGAMTKSQLLSWLASHGL